MFSILAIILFSSFLIYKLYFNSNNEYYEKNVIISKADITNPKFAINNSSKKIFVTAKEGNFMDNGKILLKKNVKFKSNEFSIESDNVIFDRESQDAYSENKSIFKANKTVISSEGFNIYENGNKINFNGNSKIILK